MFLWLICLSNLSKMGSSSIGFAYCVKFSSHAVNNSIYPSILSNYLLFLQALLFPASGLHGIMNTGDMYFPDEQLLFPLSRAFWILPVSFRLGQGLCMAVEKQKCLFHPYHKFFKLKLKFLFMVFFIFL